MITHPCRQRRGSVDAAPVARERLVGAAKVVVHHREREGVRVVLDLLTERIGHRL